jgi:hypothetical protein
MAEGNGFSSRFADYLLGRYNASSIDCLSFDQCCEVLVVLDFFLVRTKGEICREEIQLLINQAKGQMLNRKI